MYGGQSTHIPLKVNGAGVIPVIFAVSLLMFPITIAQFWSTHSWATWVQNHMYYDKPLGMTLYVLLIIGFTFFYTFVQINPVQMADQMKKNGGYIPGIRPGKPTSFLHHARYDEDYAKRCDILGGYLDSASILRHACRFTSVTLSWVVPLC